MDKRLANCPVLQNIDILLPFGIALLRKLGLLGVDEQPTDRHLSLMESAAEEADRANESAFQKLKKRGR